MVNQSKRATQPALKVLWVQTVNALQKGSKCMTTKLQAIRKWLMNACSTIRVERSCSRGLEMKATSTTFTEISMNKTHTNLMTSGTEWLNRWVSTTKATGLDTQEMIAENKTYGMKVAEDTTYRLTRSQSTLRCECAIRARLTIWCPHSQWLYLIDRGMRLQWSRTLELINSQWLLL